MRDDQAWKVDLMDDLWQDDADGGDAVPTNRIELDLRAELAPAGQPGSPVDRMVGRLQACYQTMLGSLPADLAVTEQVQVALDEAHGLLEDPVGADDDGHPRLLEEYLRLKVIVDRRRRLVSHAPAPVRGSARQESAPARRPGRSWFAALFSGR